MKCLKVKAIKKIGKMQTYDLHTPIYHNFFLSNGILSHNSGKSYTSLRIAELWYKEYFKEDFPEMNICFSIDELLMRLHNKNLRRGELLIFEEAGTSAGSLDFQARTTKIFNYILQSFRSLNIGLLVNLPYFSMLNKQSRQLMHILMETESIDRKNKQCILKCFFLQTNQDTGKIYKHFPRVVIDGEMIPIERFGFTLPSQKLQDAYEIKKEKFVRTLISDSIDELTAKRARDKQKILDTKEDTSIPKDTAVYQSIPEDDTIEDEPAEPIQQPQTKYKLKFQK
jgi:hypothetical protein